MGVDPRFFRPLGPVSVQDLAQITGSQWLGESRRDTSGARSIDGLAPADRAGSSQACFFDGRKADLGTVSSKAAACFVKSDFADGLPDGVDALCHPNPRYAFTLAVAVLHEHLDHSAPGSAPAIHETAIVSPSAHISAGAAIGEGAVIGPGAIIGPGVQIGRHTRIGAQASVQCALIGNHVTILAGARIGEAGFGATVGPNGPVDVPQLGRVILQDHVTIGANTCVDRGALDDTVIGERTKIDNLCQIAHNVMIGRNVLIASFTGISGSSVIEDGVVMGGRVGIADHVTIGKGAQLTASAGIFRDIPAGERWAGIPAKPWKQFFRETAWLQKQAAVKKDGKG